MIARANVRTTERVAVVLFLVLLLMVVYQNCGMPVKMTDNMVHKLGDADVKSLQGLDLPEKQTLCESSSFYTCEHEVLDPKTVDPLETNYTKCSNAFGTEERFCASVTMLTQNGTSYRETVRCRNHMIRNGQDFPVVAESDNLDLALSQVLASCKSVLQY